MAKKLSKKRKITTEKTIHKTKKIIKSKVDPFKRTYAILRNNISLHEVSIREIGAHAQKYDKNALAKLKGVMGNIGKKLKGKGKKFEFSANDLKAILDTSKKLPEQSDLFIKNTLVSIVSTLDMVFIKLFEFYYKEFPEKLSIENQSIRFKDLENINKIEDAQNFLITREIETLLIRDGINERLNILSKEVGIDINAIDKHLTDLKKLVKIRNLIVHNECVADSEYIKKYGDGKIKVGDRINLSQKYLTDSLYLVYFLGAYILQDMQMHFSKNLKSKGSLLNNPLHAFIKAGQHNFSRAIYDFALNNKIDDLNKKCIIINFCVGLKKQGKSNEHINRIITLEDWSIEKDDFEMCKAALLDKHEIFYSYLNKGIKDEEITICEIDEWIIFDFYRNKSKFKLLRKKLK